MRVPLSWLADFVEIPVEPARLAADLTVVGLAVDAVESDGRDTVLDLDITTNRVDCMNIRGVAREVSTLYRKPLKPLEMTFSESGPPASESLQVRVEAEGLCPRFHARVLDVGVEETPAWIRDRLEAVGVRSINNVVDITNYVMMEMGQPTHAFDLALIPDGRLVVRWARNGERLVTLDDVERTLEARVGVVAGPEPPLALAGIMGGASSEVSGATRSIALEAAYWEPLAIRRAARFLGMHTEASHRFERGADPEAPPAATARIAHLLQRVGRATVRPGAIDRRAAGLAGRSTSLRPARTGIVLGVAVGDSDWRRTLTSLGFGVGKSDGDTTALTIPSWRGDVSREIDVIEEIGRHHGLDKVRSTIPPTALPGGLKPWQSRERALVDELVGAGLSEASHYAFISEAEASALPGPRVALENPLSEEQAVLRNSLVVPGLLGALRTNVRQGRRSVRLFEIGRVFLPAGGEAPLEERRLGLVLAGAMGEPHWSEKARPADFFDGKGVLEAALGRLGAADLLWTTEGLPAHLHPGRAALVALGGRVLGYVGAVHPDVAAAFELKDEAIVAEVAVDGLLREEPRPVRSVPLPRFPAVARDLSLVCDAARLAAEIEKVASRAAGPLLRSVVVADRYDGPPVPEGKVSLMLGLVFQHPERTLAGEEVQEAMDRVAGELRASGAEIRGE